jgi:hypothetical protein
MPLRGIPPYDRHRTLSASGIAVTPRSTGLHLQLQLQPQFPFSAIGNRQSSHPEAFQE